MFPEAALDPGFPFFPNEKGERGSKHAFQATVEMAAELLGLPSRGPRGEAYFTGHVCWPTPLSIEFTDLRIACGIKGCSG